MEKEAYNLIYYAKKDLVTYELVETQSAHDLSRRIKAKYKNISVSVCFNGIAVTYVVVI